LKTALFISFAKEKGPQAVKWERQGKTEKRSRGAIMKEESHEKKSTDRMEGTGKENII